MSRSVITPKPRTGGPGLPPVDHDKHYGGGGDRGGQGPRGDRLMRYRFGLAAAMVSVLILFGAAVLTFLHRYYFGRWDLATSRYVRDWTAFQLPTAILMANTVVLTASSACAELARRAAASAAIFAPLEVLGITSRERRIELWCWASAVLGIAFLCGQYVAWLRLQAGGLHVATGPSTTFFYLLTGTHAAHVVGGVLGLTWAGFTSVLRRSLETQRVVTDIATWYWHALGVLWLALLAILVKVSA